MSRARDLADLAGSAEAGGITGANALINGDMQVWQRGTSQTSTGYGCVDRWRNTVSGTVTFSQDTSGLPLNFEYALRWTTGASSSYGQSRQFIETSTVKIIRGQTIALSAYAKVSGTYSGVVSWEIGYATTGDGSGESYTTITPVNNVTASSADASSDYKRISCNVTIPSNALGLYIGIVPSVVQASGEWVSVTGVKCELGTTITTFQREPFETTLQKCQRYYEKTYPYATTPGTASSYNTISALGIAGMDEETSGQRYMTYPWMVEKRTAPTLTIYDQAGNSGKVTTLDNAGTQTHNVGVALAFAGTYVMGAGPSNSAIWGLTFFCVGDSEL